MKDRYPSLTQRIFSYSPSEFLISSITVFELEFGAAKSKWSERSREILAMFLAPFTILPFDLTDAIAAAGIRHGLEQKGTPIGPYDLMIAAQAIAGGHTVVTHNIDEFKRVPDLKVEDWTV